MKLNTKLKEPFQKMVALEIPIKKRRKYIQKAFICGFKSQPEYKFLNKQLDELTKENVCSADAVKKIDLAFRNLYNRYSEENYQHYHSDHPHHTF